MIKKRIESSKDGLWKDLLAIYEYSFPSFERRGTKSFEALLAEQRAQLDVYLENGVIVGFMLYWYMRDFKYLEFFAINRQMRGNNYGSRLMEDFCDDDRRVILEIEPPVDEMTKKRLRFYERLGFVLNDYDYIHPSFQHPPQPHTLKIMSNRGKLGIEDYEEYISLMKNLVLRYGNLKDFSAFRY